MIVVMRKPKFSASNSAETKLWGQHTGQHSGQHMKGEKCCESSVQCLFKVFWKKAKKLHFDTEKRLDQFPSAHMAVA